MTDQLLTVDGFNPDQARPSEHFSWKEVACQATGKLPELQCIRNCHGKETRTPFGSLCFILEEIRADVGKPLVITSWFRSKEHHIEQAKRYKSQNSSYLGAHSTGLAVDVRVQGDDALQFIRSAQLNAAELYLPIGLGLLQTGPTGRYIHLDLAGLHPEFVAPRPALWTY